MVIIHIAKVNSSVIGGVQVAIPKMLKAQSRYADVCLLNIHSVMIDDIQTILYDGKFDLNKFPKPYNNPDLIVFHEIYMLEYIAIYRKLEKLGIPYIIVPHGGFSKEAQQKKRMKKVVANMLFFNNFFKKAKKIQYLSSNEQNMSVFKQYPWWVFGNGVSVPMEKKSFFQESEIKFVYIGRLEIHIKGLDLLLNAVKKSESVLRKNNAVVEIYGPNYSDSHQIIQKMIQNLRIDDLVKLDKEKIGADKQQILLSASCFIQTSRTEGMPLGPLEALGYGLPCIVTQGTGLGEMIESYGAGLRCETTVEGISEAIGLFIQSIAKVEQMSLSARRLVEDIFDINVIAQRTVDGYLNIFE